jgi:hypothetical protein
MRDYGQFCDTAHAYTTADVSENSVDLQAADKRLGHGGKPIIGHMRVNTAFAGAASGVRIFIVDDSDATLASPRVIAQLVGQNTSDEGVTPVTDIDGIGDHLQAVIPPGIKLQRYIGFRVVPASEVLTTGDVDSWFDDQAESYEGS